MSRRALQFNSNSTPIAFSFEGMTNAAFTESVVEDAALGWLASLGWRDLRGPEIAPGTPGAERGAYELALRCWDRFPRGSSCHLLNVLSKITQYVE